MFRNKVLLCLLLLLPVWATLAAGAAAHEVYLSIDDHIEVGHETEVRLFWGHFPDIPDPESSYFNLLTAGRFYIIDPEGKEQNLILKNNGDYYSASFTPRRAGDHWAVFSHNRGILDWTHGEPQGKQLVTVYSKALLDVHGDDEIVAFSRVAGHDLEILPLVDGGHLHAGEEYMAQLLYFGQPLSGVNIAYYGPGEKTGETISGDGGTFSFIPDEEGEWLIKLSYMDQSRTSWNGEEMIGARYTVTALLTPHAHYEENTPFAPTGKNSPTFAYLGLIVILLFGSLFLYRKTTAKQ